MFLALEKGRDAQADCLPRQGSSERSVQTGDGGVERGLLAGVWGYTILQAGAATLPGGSAHLLGEDARRHLRPLADPQVEALE